MATAIYAGSFDPITNGHLWVIDTASKIFDKLIVAAGDNANKSYTFSLEERIELLKESLTSYKNIEVKYFQREFLVNYAIKSGAKYIIRGVRNHRDYEYEKNMRYINSDLDGQVETIFLIPPRQYAEVSSSLVKGLVGPNDWERVVAKYVPHTVIQSLREMHEKKYTK